MEGSDKLNCAEDVCIGEEGPEKYSLVIEGCRGGSEREEARERERSRYEVLAAPYGLRVETGVTDELSEYLCLLQVTRRL
jgi:hypothetical protein